jgi:alpha-L-fucosidase 2
VLDHYWQHWRYTQDRAFLRDRFYPVLREVCRFYLDYLQDDGQRLVIYPSQSPENRIPQRSHSFHGLNSTYDLAIFRDVLERTDQIARLLSLRDEVAQEAAAALPRLAAFARAGDGRLREMEDHEFQRGHRHFSHLYPVFPSGRIGIDDPLRTAAIQALDAVDRYPSTGEAPWFARVGYGAWAGWTYTVKACTLARLGLAQRAARALEGYARAFTYPSGLARCFEREDLGFGIQSSPDIGQWIEIDSSCAAVAAIQEMLLQSHGGVLRLLPALPRAWDQGQFTGWRGEGGFIVDAQWRRGRLRHAVIRSELGGPCRLRLPTNHDWRITRGSRPVAGALARNILTLDTRPGQRLEVTSR